MEERTRQCIKCKQRKPEHEFAYSPSKFMPGHRSWICTSCLETMIKSDDLDSIDRLMQHLDLPFDINKWENLYKIHGDHTLTIYLNSLIDTDVGYAAAVRNGATAVPATGRWREENTRWALAREELAQTDIVSEARTKRLQKIWSDEYTPNELEWLDNFYNDIIATQNVSTPILQALARNLCELQLRINKGLREGADVKKDMDARDNIIKNGKFEANNSKNASDFDSVGELMVYLEKEGWHPKWHNEPQDSVDFCMKNIQDYLRRLVIGEGNLLDQVETTREMYNTKERLEALGENDFKIEAETPDEYEDEEELAGELSDWTINPTN